MFTFGLKGGYDAGVKLVSNVKLFSHLANVGDTRSLIIHPASTTHSQFDDAQKAQAGAGPEVVRLSVGIEDKDDIIAVGPCVRRDDARGFGVPNSFACKYSFAISRRVAPEVCHQFPYPLK